MKPDLLLAHFERLADAPDAIPRLRRFILDLAVRGKLVEQDPNDEPASELLKRINAERADLVNRRRNRASFTDAGANKHPFLFPKNWLGVQLGDLSILITSGSRDWSKFYDTTGRAIFVRMGNLSRDSYLLRMNNIQRVNPPEDGEGTRTKLQEDDILISITGEVGLLGLIPPDFGEAYINQHTCVVRITPQLRGRFVPEVLRSTFAQDQLRAPQPGLKNSARLSDVVDLVVPLPPFAEQHRIVAKVDELMELCDRLEAARNERESRRDRLAWKIHQALAGADQAVEIV